MGGLAVHLSREGSPDAARIRRMLDAVPHRGDRTETGTLGQALFGVCNDPGRVTATLQGDGNRLVAFHGSLDNEGEIRAELGERGARAPAADTPAATALAAVEAWGDDAVSMFRGSFCGAVTDGRAVRCFRDHFGTRPLFHHDGAAGFFAASEVKQVLEGADLRRRPNLEHLHRTLFGAVDRTTAYRDVERIPPRAVAAAGPGGGVRTRSYWDPSEFVEAADLDLDEAVAGTREALRRAVRRTLTGEDAILLSGGLDSPALAACAGAGSSAEGVRAVTAVYPEHPSTDEREWTERAAGHVGLPLHTYEAQAGSLDDLEFWVRALDGPVSVFSIPESAEAYRSSREAGARTVLTGEMAELLFENRYYLLDHLLSHGRLAAAGRLLRRLRRDGAGRLDLVRRIARAVAPGPLLDALRDDDAGTRRDYPAWVDEDVPRRLLEDPGDRTAGPRRRWVEVQTAPFRGPGVGFEVDEICAEHCGVDVRRPFVDVDLWEFVLGLPAEVRYPTGRTKPLLRKAMRGMLPDSLIDRRDKTYFDEFHLATADYGTLRQLLVGPDRRLDGIDYDLLADRIEREEMGVYELQWARNVARAHAFLEQW